MLISIHMPKTAGSSFRATLEEVYGAGLAADYGDYPLATPVRERHSQALEHCLSVRPECFAGKSCVHGHFMPVKYLLLADHLECRFVTWLREPLERLVSHYHYWQRSYDPDAVSTSTLHRRVVEEAWTLEKFCLSPALRNVYTEFLWAFPLRRLDFVGITEHYEEDLREFSAKFLGRETAPRSLNKGEGKSRAAELPSAFQARVRDFHRQDVQLYDWALRQRRQRLTCRL